MMAPMAVTPRVFGDQRALGAALANRIISGITNAGQTGRRYLLGCPGGRSLRSTYRMLEHLATTRAVDLSPLVIVMMDDYVARGENGFLLVPIEAHYSCRRFAVEEIAAPLASLHGAPDRSRIWLPDPPIRSATTA